MKFDHTNKPLFVNSILGIFLFFIFFLLDYHIYPVYAPTLLLVRIAITLWLIFCVYLLFKVSEEQLSLVAVLYLVPGAFSMSLLCYIVGEGFSSIYFVGVLLVIIGGANFAQIKPFQFAILMTVIFLQHFFICFMCPVVFNDFLINLFLLGSAVFLAVFMQGSLRRYETALLQTQEELCQAVSTDSLTNLLNRRKMIELIHRESACSERSGRPYAVAIGDIDNFAAINEVYGHDDGDEVLRCVAKMLRGSLRTQDFISRWGGEEFLILLPETDLEGAQLGVDRIRSYIERTPVFVASETKTVTMTFGLASSKQGKDVDELIRFAGEALYRGKHGSKNCVAVYEEIDPAEKRDTGQS